MAETGGDDSKISDALGCGCAVATLLVLLPFACVAGMLHSCEQSFKEDPLGSGIVLGVLALLGLGIVVVGTTSRSQAAQPRTVSAPTLARQAQEPRRFRVEGQHLALLAVLRARPQGEPFVEFSTERSPWGNGDWEDGGLIRVLPLSEALAQAAQARSAQTAWQIGPRYDERLSSAEAYHLESWLLEL